MSEAPRGKNLHGTVAEAYRRRRNPRPDLGQELPTNHARTDGNGTLNQREPRVFYGREDCSFACVGPNQRQMTCLTRHGPTHEHICAQLRNPEGAVLLWDACALIKGGYHLITYCVYVYTI